MNEVTQMTKNSFNVETKIFGFLACNFRGNFPMYAPYLCLLILRGRGGGPTWMCV